MPTLSQYCDLIDSILAAGYRFERFDGIVSSGPDDKRFLLRHDVDISPENALRMGQAAAKKGIVANFFFQFNAETYNLFSERNRTIVKILRSLGHCVGLHIDKALFPPEEDLVEATISWFSRCVVPVDQVVSFHRPPPEVVERHFEAFINTYEPRYFNPDCYFSDSRRSQGFMEALEQAMADGMAKIQLLLHPVWWHSDCTNSELRAMIERRRRSELHAYLKHNFNKVFGEHTDDEDSTSGV